MKSRADDPPCLWVEAVKLRPTALRVLHALAVLERSNSPMSDGISAQALAEVSKLNPHVVRARLCDLRRLALAASGPTLRGRSAHWLTDYGRRRLNASR